MGERLIGHTVKTKLALSSHSCIGGITSCGRRENVQL
jgi:hypothetical protein